MWSVWGALVLLLAAVSLYASRLTRDEEDQIFLGEGFEHEKSQQAAIASKIGKLEPIKHLALGLVGAMTLIVVLYYVVDMIRQFK